MDDRLRAFHGRFLKLWLVFLRSPFEVFFTTEAQRHRESEIQERKPRGFFLVFTVPLGLCGESLLVGKENDKLNFTRDASCIPLHAGLVDSKSLAA